MSRLLIFMAVFLSSLSTQAQSNFNALLVKANSGDIAAQLQVAKSYRFGADVPKNMTESIRWFYAAAANGNGEAAYTLGTLAYNGDVLGDNVRQSEVQAWVWFEAAEAAGYLEAAEARDRLESELIPAKLRQAHEIAATLFLYGGRFPATPKFAVRELEWLDQHGASGAAIMLATLYIEGKLVARDVEKAKALCKKVERDGHLGAHYCQGKIQSELGDDKAAFGFFKKDAEAVYPNAMLELAQRYNDGRGINKDKVAAYTWALRCDALRTEGCKELKQQLASQLNDRDREKALKEAGKLRIASGMSIADVMKRTSLESNAAPKK